MSDFVAGEGHRWWLDPNKCPHYNENVCAGCDFDRYYAKTYASVPWRVPPEQPWETTLSDDTEPGDLG